MLEGVGLGLAGPSPSPPHPAARTSPAANTRRPRSSSLEPTASQRLRIAWQSIMPIRISPIRSARNPAAPSHIATCRLTQNPFICSGGYPKQSWGRDRVASPSTQGIASWRRPRKTADEFGDDEGVARADPFGRWRGRVALLVVEKSKNELRRALIAFCRAIDELRHRRLELGDAPWPAVFLRFDLFAERRRQEPAEGNYGDGLDGAPNGISVPRWSWSSTHLKGSRPWASLSLNCRLSRVSGSIWRRTRSKSTASTRRARSSSPASCGAARWRNSSPSSLLASWRWRPARRRINRGAAIAGARLRGQADPAGECKTVSLPSGSTRCGGDLRGGGAARATVRAGAR